MVVKPIKIKIIKKISLTVKSKLIIAIVNSCSFNINRYIISRIITVNIIFTIFNINLFNNIFYYFYF